MVLTLCVWILVVFSIVILAVQQHLLYKVLHELRTLAKTLETREIPALQPVALDVARPPAGGGLPLGSTAPAFTLPGLYNETLSLESLRSYGLPTLLAFLDPRCGHCAVLLPELAYWQHELAGVAILAIVSSGSVQENRAWLQAHALTHVVLQRDYEVGAAYGVPGTPCMVLVGVDGTIAAPLAQGASQIHELVALLRMPPPAPASGPQQRTADPTLDTTGA